jgi:GNAT superfamily N-acetyltransferase
MASLQDPAPSMRGVGGREVLSLPPHPSQAQGGPLEGGLTGLFGRLAEGHVPAADASVTVLPAPLGARAVVVGGTAWHVVAADVDHEWVAKSVADDPIAAPLGARFLSALADRIGAEPGVVDAVLVAPAAPVRGLELHPAELDHPRVERSRLHRSDVRVWAAPDGSGLLTVGRGVAGRWEVSLEVEPGARRRGLGTTLARAARALVPAGSPVWAQVAPANTASLRAFLAAGYRPVGAEVLFGP